MTLNTRKPKRKVSRVERKMNIQVGINFGILVTLCMICAIGTSIWRTSMVPANAIFMESAYKNTTIVQNTTWYISFTTFW
jgi:hypothetical protein